jgi:hypothetical protein
LFRGNAPGEPDNSHQDDKRSDNTHDKTFLWFVVLCESFKDRVRTFLEERAWRSRIVLFLNCQNHSKRKHFCQVLSLDNHPKRTTPCQNSFVRNQFINTGICIIILINQTELV